MREQPCTLETNAVLHDSKQHEQPPNLLKQPPLKLTTFLSYLLEDLQSFWRQVRHCAEKTSNTSVHYMLLEKSMYAVLTMLIGFVIFWMSFIFAILSGSIAILLFSLTSAIRFGLRIKRSVQNIRTRLNA